MAIKKSAKKTLRVSARKRVYNIRRNRTAHDVLKRVQKLVAEGKRTEAEAMLASAYKAIDKAGKGGVIKKNTAARRKSRIARLVSAK